MRIADATVLVTGASGGIGAASAARLHQLGAHLVLHGRHPDRLFDLATQLDAQVVLGDLAEPEVPAEVAHKAGQVDILVHCAGIGLRGLFAESADEQVDRLVAVNLRAPLALARELLPAMCAAGRGHLAFVCSIAGLTGVGSEAVYAATKAGLLTFAQSLRLELAKHGVTVSTISPAVVRTGFWDARGAGYHRRTPRPMAAEIIADLLVRDIAAGTGDRIVPRWLAVAPAVRAVTPVLYRRLAQWIDGR